MSNWLVKENFSGTDIYEVAAKTILNPAKGFMSSYDFTLNPYRGCQYGCSYCYAAAFSPDRDRRQQWGDWVVIKQNAAQLLDRELARWQHKQPNNPPRIYLSSVTDPYQAIEVKTQLNRSLLEVMLVYQPTLVIQTRSPMIIRDRDLLAQFQRLRINLSIPTGSDRVRRDFELRSPSIKARLQTLKKLRYSLPTDVDHDIRLTVTMTPLLPTLPEDEADLFAQLAIADRIVLQDFHPQRGGGLQASTRDCAIAIKQKYAWWYDNPDSYPSFKQRLTDYLTALGTSIEIMEGKAGFGYD